MWKASILPVTANLSRLTGKDMTILPRHKDVAKSRLKMSNPWHLLAVGFGSGLSPIVLVRWDRWRRSLSGI